jgi:DNA-binding NarL/FixJ family response regulator
MSVKVLIADDSLVMRKALRSFLESQTEILLVGEADTLSEAILKSEQLHPDIIVMDLHLSDESKDPMRLKSFLNGAKLLAITFAADEVSKALAEAIGAEKLVDKSNIVEELVPAILELAAEPNPA